MNLYERLQDACKFRGISITALCTKVTGNGSNLVTWKKNYMRSDYLSGCADVLQCSTDYLLGRTKDSNYISYLMNHDSPLDDTDSSTVKLSSLNEHDQQYISNERAAGNNPTFGDLAEHRNESKHDPMVEEFIKQFNNLDFVNKVKTMNYVLDLLEK